VLLRRQAIVATAGIEIVLFLLVHDRLPRDLKFARNLVYAAGRVDELDEPTPKLGRVGGALCHGRPFDERKKVSTQLGQLHATQDAEPNERRGFARSRAVAMPMCNYLVVNWSASTSMSAMLAAGQHRTASCILALGRAAALAAESLATAFSYAMGMGAAGGDAAAAVAPADILHAFGCIK
jgi:hypothetical protein